MTKRLFTFGMVGIVALFSVPVGPAFATELSAGQGPAPFQALSGLPDGHRIELAAMTDEQLAAVEGAAFYCGVCIKAVGIQHLKESARLQRLLRRAARIAARIQQENVRNEQRLLRRAARIAARIRQENVSVNEQRLHRHGVGIRQVNVNVKGDNTHQSNTMLVIQRN
jgi:hypothetical protein